MFSWPTGNNNLYLPMHWVESIRQSRDARMPSQLLIFSYFSLFTLRMKADLKGTLSFFQSRYRLTYPNIFVPVFIVFRFYTFVSLLGVNRKWERRLVHVISLSWGKSAIDWVIVFTTPNLIKCSLKVLCHFIKNSLSFFFLGWTRRNFKWYSLIKLMITCFFSRKIIF